MNLRSDKQIKEFLEDKAHMLDVPEAFIGDEVNTVGKERAWEAPFKWLQCAAYPYTQAMGNYSVPLIYSLVNQNPAWLADRCYSLNSHKEDNIFVKNGIPMFGIGSKRPMGAFDVVGFSLNYSLLFQNVVRMMQISGIPRLAATRHLMAEHYPLFIVGSNVFGQPMGCAPVFDMVWVGDLEDEYRDGEITNPGINFFLDLTASWMQKESDRWYTPEVRHEYLEDVARQCDWIFVPSLYSTSHERGTDNRWRFKSITPLSESAPTVIKKRIVKDLDGVPALIAPPISYYDPEGMGTGEIEASRSCSAKCLFCASMWRYAPFRTRSADKLVELFKANAVETGAVELSPLTLEWGTHPLKKQITKRIMEEVSDSFSAPSLRVDNVAEDPNFPIMMREADKKQITLGVEGCSQRLRTGVSKGITEEEILKAIDNAIKAGMRRIKIYMISGLPGETPEDIQELVSLAEKADNIRRVYEKQNVQIRFSFTPLVVQGNTPLQWVGIDLDKKSLGDLYPQLRDLGMDFTLGKKGRSETRYYGQLFELADRVAGEALLEVAEQLQCHYFGALPADTVSLLISALAQRDRTLNDYFCEKDDRERFEWDIIDTLVSKDFLWKLYEESRTFLTTGQGGDKGYLKSGAKCVTKCVGCHACDADNLKKMVELRETEDDKIKLLDINTIDQRSVSQKLRMQLWIPEKYRYVRPAFWRTVIRRAAFKSGLPITKRHIKSSSDGVDVNNWMSGIEFFEIGLQHSLSMPELNSLMEDFKQYLHDATLIKYQPFPKTIETLKFKKVVNLYRVEVEMPQTVLRSNISSFMDDENAVIPVKVEQHQGGTVTNYISVDDAVYKMWDEKKGFRTYFFVATYGNISPYSVLYAINGGLRSGSFRNAAIRFDAFLPPDVTQDDWFVESCPTCGQPYYMNIMGDIVHFCIKCRMEGRCSEHPVEEFLNGR